MHLETARRRRTRRFGADIARRRRDLAIGGARGAPEAAENERGREPKTRGQVESPWEFAYVPDGTNNEHENGSGPFRTLKVSLVA